MLIVYVFITKCVCVSIKNRLRRHISLNVYVRPESGIKVICDRSR